MAIPGTFPLQYTGVNAPNPAQPYIFHRDPTVTDYIGYNINDIWLNQRKIPGNPPTYNTSHIWQLVSKAQNIGTWIEISHTGLTEDLPAHSVVLGLGVPGLGSTGPDASIGIPLISQGLGSDPLFGTCLVEGGGTGQEALANHSVLVGADVAGITQVSPNATLGQPLVSNGTNADPSFGTASVSGGGTGLDAIPQYSVVCGGISGEGPLQTVSGLGTMGQVLTSQGLAALPQWADGSGGGGNGGPIKVQVFTTTGTYTPTLGMASCIVEIIGGGGGGSVDIPANTAQGGGGGSGGYCRKFFLASSVGSSQTVTIGAGGAATVNGGNTLFGSLLTADGGTSGGDGTSSVPGVGGLGGSASGGDLNVTGGSGGSTGLGVGFTAQVSGFGGNNLYGSGGAGVTSPTVSVNGIDGTVYGSGGSGGYAISTSIAATGGSGQDGLIVVTEFGPYAPTPPPNAVQLNTIVFDTPGADRYTPSPGMFQCTVECVGGGGGTFANATPFPSTGAGAGGYCKKLFDSATIGAYQAIVVGAGGAISSTNTGNPGGNTTFGTFLTANGGSGATLIVGANPAGGTASGGDINISGGNGAQVALGGVVNAVGGIGGSSLLGQGGNTDYSANGVSGTGYGSGPSGITSGAGAATGLVGQGGVIIVTEYIS